MTARFAAAASLFLLACPPAAPPAPPAPPVDSGVLTPCGAACAALTAACGPQQPNCETTLQAIDDNRLLREASGKPFACEDVLSAHDAASMRALGLPCP